MIMNNACTLTRTPNARILPVNIIPHNTPTNKREGEMTHQTDVFTPATAQGSTIGKKRIKHTHDAARRDPCCKGDK